VPTRRSPGCLDGRDLEATTLLVDHQGRERLALHILGNDDQRFAGLYHCLKQRQRRVDRRYSPGAPLLGFWSTLETAVPAIAPAAAFMLMPRDLRCRNRKRGRFRWRMMIALRGRRMWPSIARNVLTASAVHSRKCAIHPFR
jgi:hypothetical protein